MLIAMKRIAIMTGLVALTTPCVAQTLPTPAPFRTPVAGPRNLQEQDFSIKGALSAPIKGVALALYPRRRAYKRRRFVPIILHFSNATRRFYKYSSRAIRWTVVGPSVVHHSLGRGDQLFAVHGLDPITPKLSENEYNLADFVTFREPGTYAVQANVHVLDLGIDVTSPAVTIVVE